MHGPCGLANPKSQCMNEGICSKKFKTQTAFDDNGFVYYRRRDLKDNFVIKNGIQLNNRYVVPYNRELLLRYNAHINIEICCQSMLIKYLFKYISKGSNRCRVVVEKDRADEIHTYMNCRFICPYESVGRLLEFPIHSRSPPVERLQIHLPLHQNVVYSGNESLPSVLQKPGIEKTMLTEWFASNRIDHEARQLYYSLPSVLQKPGDDKEWEDVFCEAMDTATSPQIRNLFVNVVLFCDVADPEVLFSKFWRSMYDDIITRFKSSFVMPNLKLFDDELKNYVLYKLELLFNVAGTSLEKHKLPMPDGRLLSEIKNKLWFDPDGLIDLAVASSGIASLLLPGGRTAHLRFKIPLTVSDTSSCEIKKKTDLARLLEMTSLIVWDEAPMNNRCCFEALDRSLRDVLTNGNDLPNDKPFGGKSILLGGDFRQILPVILGGTKEDIVHASLCSSVLWSKFKVLTLTEIRRLSSNGLSNDQKKELAIFANWILAIGDGTQHDALFPDDSDASMIKIPQDLLLEPGSNPILAIVSAVYPSIRDINIDPCYFRERAIVTPRNATVSEINDFILNMLPGMKRIYLSTDTVCKTSSDGDNADICIPLNLSINLSSMECHPTQFP
ncbi:PREDICTED: uncharacterized protein LOC105142549 [Populus euphratica]|uniref:ATP-dependent DNA helicase n=1 Tax=Populus euphratica TaxID=75702 RepID=A0AAJ6YAI4_POPEU|nr:PREDICTED: uncharacterized protein LOC105142549 [Populus euphratica]